MSKGLGSTFSITQQVCQCFSKQICYGNYFVSILAQLLHCTYAISLTVLLQVSVYACTLVCIIYYAIYKRQEL